MRFNKTDRESFRFIDDVKFGTHSMLLYDQEADCLAVQFRWLLNGMKKYQYSLFLTHEDPATIENKMYDFGIDVDTHKESLLDVIQIPDFMSDPHSVLSQNEALMKKILRGRGPCRITGRTVQNLDSTESKAIELDIEKKAQSEFDRFGMSFLCPYPMSVIKDKKDSTWVRQTVQNHDNVIYVPHQGNCTVFGSHGTTLETQLEQEKIL